MTMNGKLFKISKPYGYYIPEVDATIQKYNEAIADLKNMIIDYQSQIKQLQAENTEFKQELKAMHMQMSMLELPDMSDAQEHLVLSEFKNMNGSSGSLKFDDAFNDGSQAKSEKLTKLNQISQPQSGKDDEYTFDPSIVVLSENDKDLNKSKVVKYDNQVFQIIE